MQTLSFGILAVVFTACSSDPSTKTPPVAPVKAAPVAAPDTAAALATPQQFLRWYAPRVDSLSSVCVAPAACNRDTADQYVVDFKLVEVYLAGFNRSGFLSTAYLDTQRDCYRQYSDEMKTHPQFDGPPEFSDFDPITYSQDSDALLDVMQAQPQLVRFARDSATVGLLKQYENVILEFHLSRHGPRWLIDEITTNVLGPK